jgi:sRNA-binding carbon storage regulator CsrA
MIKAYRAQQELKVDASIVMTTVAVAVEGVAIAVPAPVIVAL